MPTASNQSIPWTFVLDEPVRLLVVDDDPILREFASVYLATPCATIDTARDVATARTQLRDNTYDIVLLDIEMPQVNGFTLLEEIRSDEKLKHVPVIMLTGHDDIVSIDRAYQTGANSFATKPVNWRQLSYQVRYVLRTTANQRTDNSVETAAAAGDVRGFLQSVVLRANSLADRIAQGDHQQLVDLLREIAAYGERAIGECAHHPLNSDNVEASAAPMSNVA